MRRWEPPAAHCPAPPWHALHVVAVEQIHHARLAGSDGEMGIGPGHVRQQRDAARAEVEVVHVHGVDLPRREVVADRLQIARDLESALLEIVDAVIGAGVGVSCENVDVAGPVGGRSEARHPDCAQKARPGAPEPAIAERCRQPVCHCVAAARRQRSCVPVKQPAARCLLMLVGIAAEARINRAVQFEERGTLALCAGGEIRRRAVDQLMRSRHGHRGDLVGEGGEVERMQDQREGAGAADGAHDIHRPARGIDDGRRIRCQPGC